MPDRLVPAFLPFIGGIDTRSHPHVLQAPYLRRANNVVYNRGIGAQKRWGYQALPKAIASGGSITKGGALRTLGNEILVQDNASVLSWSPGLKKWVARDAMEPSIFSSRPLAPTGYGTYTADWARCTSQGMEAVAYRDSRSSGALRLTILDATTNTQIVSDVVVVASGAGAFRLVALPDRILFFYAATVGGVVYLCSRVISPGLTGGVGNECRLCANVDNINWEACYDAACGCAIVAYLRLSSPGGGSLLAVTPSGGVRPGYATDMGALPGTAVGPATAISVSSSGGGLYPITVVVYFQDVDGWRLYVRGASFVSGTPVVFTYPQPATRSSSYSSAVTVLTGSDGQSWTASAYYQLYDSVTSNPLRTDTQIFTGTTTAAGAPTTVRGAAVVAKPFARSGVPYFFFVSNTANTTATDYVQPTYFLMSTKTWKVVARFGNGVADCTNQGTAGVYSDGHDGYEFCALQSTALRSVNGTVTTQKGATAWKIRFTDARLLQAANAANELILTSSTVTSYDGARVAEHGFAFAPVFGTPTLAATGGLSAGTYLYYAIWECYDALGQIHRSAPSAPLSVTASASSHVTLQVQPLHFSNKANVTLAIYRTVVNGVVAYRQTPFPNPITGQFPVDNNPNVDYLTVVDGTPDTLISGNEILYTVGGELANDAPPASTIALAAKNRVFLAGGEYPDTITYSKEVVQGAGLSFSLALQKRITSVPGNITALAAMDDKIVVWKTGGMVFFTGRGVTASGIATGQNDDFSEPWILTTELQCLNPASIVTTADGIYFQSQKGLYLLTRSMELVYVGAPAEAYNGQTVASAVLVPSDAYLRFGCLEDTALVYHPRKMMPYPDTNQALGAWTTFSNYGQVGALVWNGKYTFLRADGTVCYETVGAWADIAKPIVRTLKTNWVVGDAPLQFMRFGAISVLGDLVSPHQLCVDIAMDYLKTPVSRMVFDSAANLLGSTWGSAPTWGAPGTFWGGVDAPKPYLFRVRDLPQQIGGTSAMQWTFTDAGPKSGGQLTAGGDLLGFTVLMEPLGTLAKLSTRQSL